MGNNTAEKIIAVEEIRNHVKTSHVETGDVSWFFDEQGDGYRVVTDHRELIFIIDNRDQCCEDWGYLASEDDLASFVGARLFEIRFTDLQLNTLPLKPAEGEDRDVCFITLHTDRGPLQMCAYTEHNGYYGHSVWFKDGSSTWKDLAAEKP